MYSLLNIKTVLPFIVRRYKSQDLLKYINEKYSQTRKTRARLKIVEGPSYIAVYVSLLFFILFISMKIDYRYIEPRARNIIR